MKKFLCALVLLVGTLSTGQQLQLEGHTWINTKQTDEKWVLVKAPSLIAPSTIVWPDPAPNYSGSSHSTAIPSYPPTPAMGTVNTTAYPYAVSSDFYYPVGGTGNCITQITDTNTFAGKEASLSASGGSTIYPFDTARNYLSIAQSGYYIESISFLNGSGCMQVNNPVLLGHSPKFSERFTFSLSAPHTAFSTEDSATGAHIPLVKHTLIGTANVTSTDTVIGDWQNCPGLPALTWPANTSEQLISMHIGGHEVISMGISDGSLGTGQGSANWMLAWDIQTGMCAVRNIVDGRMWAYCLGNCSQSGSNPAPIATTQLCPTGTTPQGMHNSFQFRDPAFLRIVRNCSGTEYVEWWQTGSANVVQPYGSGAPAGHAGMGYDTEGAISYGNGYIGSINVPNVFNGNQYSINKFFLFIGQGPAGNVHGNWSQVVTNDRGSIIATTALHQTLNMPTIPYADEVFAAVQGQSYQGARFTPTFNDINQGVDTESIGAPSQDGYCFAWTSNWNGTLPNTRYDVFAICNLQ